jgi:hypothetical protein
MRVRLAARCPRRGGGVRIGTHNRANLAFVLGSRNTDPTCSTPIPTHWIKIHIETAPREPSRQPPLPPRHLPFSRRKKNKNHPTEISVAPS